MTTPIPELTLPVDPQVLPDRKGSARRRYPTAAELQAPRPRTRGGLTDAQRLERRYTVESNGCWLWTGSITTAGYGHFSISGNYYQAHRLLYILRRGPVTTEHMDHLCRTHRCVNPWHLEPVTAAVNMQRGTRTRLTSELVDAIRIAHGNGRGVRTLARLYGVNHATISRLVNGLTWKPEQAEEAVA